MDLREKPNLVFTSQNWYLLKKSIRYQFHALVKLDAKKRLDVLRGALERLPDFYFHEER